MAKQSPAKAKKLRGEAMRAAAERRAAKAASRSEVTRGEVDLDAYENVSQWKRCLNTAIDINAKKLNCAEDRRIHWTTYQNLALWFDGWEAF